MTEFMKKIANKCLATDVGLKCFKLPTYIVHTYVAKLMNFQIPAVLYPPGQTHLNPKYLS